MILQKRTIDQNAIFHAICSDLEKSGMEWAGKPRRKDEWKVLLISGHAIATMEYMPELVEGLEGELINIRESTAKMSKERASSLIEYSLAWAAQNEIPLNDPKIIAYRQYREAS